METQVKAAPVVNKSKIDLQPITPFLWFNDNAEEAANFYTSVFKNSSVKVVSRYGAEGAKVSGRPKGTIMTVAFQIEGYELAIINGGPIFQVSPVISFFVNCGSAQEIDTLWKKLSAGGTVMMELDKYPFSERYGWIQDKFGVSWQLILPGREQKIAPCFMFTGEQHLKAEEAINFYVSVFKNSNIIQLERYGADQGPEGAVVHAKFTLNGQEFVAMDSHMSLPYKFDPAISLVVNCETQEEIDYYWDKLCEGGDVTAQQCGWLQDKFGVSWQIVPVGWGEMMQKASPEQSDSIMSAVLQMKKIDVKTIMKAYEQQ